jgi:zinc transporter ZupT
MSPFAQLVTFGLLASAGNLLGGWLIIRSRSARLELLKYLVALGAGFMLAAVCLEIIPASMQERGVGAQAAMWWMLAGYLLIMFIAHTLAPHIHVGEEAPREDLLQRGAAVRAVGALAAHTFFDGVVVASGVLTSVRTGLLLLIATLLHKVPEGFTVASVMLTAGRSRRSALRATVLVAATTLAGVVAVSLLSPAVIYTLPFSAGVTLYVAASDLIPEVNREGGARTSLLVFAGVALFYATHLLLHYTLE